MTCTTAHRLIQESLDEPGPLPADLAAHLSGCETCQAYFERLQEEEPSQPRFSGGSRRLWLIIGAIAAVAYVVLQQPRLYHLLPWAHWLGPQRGIEVSPRP